MSINDPEGYLRFTKNTSYGTREFLKEFKNKFTWDKKPETILDVGCGPGDVTTNVIMEFIPSNANIVSVDISEQMIKYANSHFRNPRITFKLLDITADNVLNVLEKEHFNKVFCLYVFHTLKDDRKALENIYSLLKPGGQIFAVMVINHYLDKVFPYLSKLPKYSKYADSLSKLTFHLGLHENHAAHTEKLLKDIGFEEISMVTKHLELITKSIEDFVEMCRVSPPLRSVLPPELIEDAVEDIRQILTNSNILEKAESGYHLRNIMLGFIARKPL